MKLMLARPKIQLFSKNFLIRLEPLPNNNPKQITSNVLNLNYGENSMTILLRRTEHRAMEVVTTIS